MSGIREFLNKNSNVNLKYEYLDVSSFSDNEYYIDTLHLLELKYNDQNIDLIITVDDEAFNFVRANLFNENSFMNKHNVFFVGVNKSITLTTDEKDYISGLIDNQDSYKSINLITNALPKVTDIYVALDENTYSNTIAESMEHNKYLIQKPVNIHYLRSNYLNDIIENIKNINPKTSAILCCGTFYIDNNKENRNDIVLENLISSSSNTPIFTTLQNYIEYGAIGGYVNDGYRIGYIAAQHSQDILTNYHNGAFIYDSSTLLDKCIIDFKQIRKYNINPAHLPKDVIYINKGRLDFLVSKPVSILIWIAIICGFVLIILLIIIYINNKNKRKEALLQLNASEEREKIKTDFLIILSHELRTPLNIILNTSKLLLDKCENNKCTQEFCCSRLEYICNNSNRLLRSINNSIDVAKLDSNVYDVNFSMINIVELIDNIVDIVAQYANDYNIDIVFDPEAEEIFTATDIEKIEKILLNLISNAIKNIPSKGTIFISCRENIENIFISIEDNGRGMSPEIKKHVFEKYFHSPFSGLSRSTEGSGLGLYIVKKFIDILDGTISVESTLGVGTTFNIVLPKREVDKVYTTKVLNSLDRMKYLTSLEFAEITKRK